MPLPLKGTWVMPKTLHAPSRTTPDAPFYPTDLEDALQTTLATLADVEHAYQKHRTMLDTWSGSAEQKNRLRAEMESLYQKHRQALVMRLADLHERIRRVTMFRTIH
jgi:hypothetical protein